MKLLGLLAIVSGFLLALLVLRLVSGQFYGFGMLAMWAGITNALTAAIGYLMFRFKNEESMAYIIGLTLGYIAGFAGGAYFHFT